MAELNGRLPAALLRQIREAFTDEPKPLAHLRSDPKTRVAAGDRHGVRRARRCAQHHVQLGHDAGARVSVTAVSRRPSVTPCTHLRSDPKTRVAAGDRHGVRRARRCAQHHVQLGHDAGARVSVIIVTMCSPAISRPSHFGTRKGGFAPTRAASAGSHSRTGAGSSSTML
jgi:hypothetical protein